MTDPGSSVRPPADERVRDWARRFGLDLGPAEFAALAEQVRATVRRCGELDESALGRTAEGAENRSVDVSHPGAGEDPLNAFASRFTLAPDGDGALSGLRVGLKDNIAVAGVEMACGSRLLAGYEPVRDATVVTRLLEAGATVAGKLNMEDMAYSGSGEVSAAGPVLNPHDPDYLAGGSSSGCGAAVVAGDVDVALGTDQGGSVRRPAACCGCVGLKPTYGLVPHTGAVGLAPTLDHVGVLSRTVEDCAAVLDVVAGPDGEDPRQALAGGARAGDVRSEPRAVRSVDTAAEVDPGAVTVGVLGEGFGLSADRGVDETVLAALDRFAAAGATVRDVSVPEHEVAPAVVTAISTHEAAATVDFDGGGRFLPGRHDERFARAFGDARRSRPDDLPLTLAVGVCAGQYLSESARGTYYARAQNARPRLAAAYDRALADVDVLAVPTVQRTAHERVADPGPAAVLERAASATENRAPFNATGHPAISLPCGTHDGLPVGVMLVGPRWADGDLLAVAGAYETYVGLSPAPP